MRDLWSIFCPLSPSDWTQDPDETIRSITLQLLGFQALQTLASAWIKFWSRVWNTGSSISVLFFIADQLRHTQYVLRHTFGRKLPWESYAGHKKQSPPRRNFNQSMCTYKYVHTQWSDNIFKCGKLIFVPSMTLPSQIIQNTCPSIENY